MKRRRRTASSWRFSALQLLARIHLHDADIDPAQEHDVAQVLQRAAADHRQHAQILAVEHIGEIGGDADIGSVGAARDHAQGAGIGAGRIEGGSRLGRCTDEAGNKKGCDERQFGRTGD